MSKWAVLDIAGMFDPSTGAPVGVLGSNGQEYLYTALGGGAYAATGAQVAALASAGTLTPGASYFDVATGITYIASSTTAYSALSTSAHLGTLAYATGIATPSPVAGMTFNASDVGNRSPLYQYSGTEWKPMGGRQLAFSLGLDAGQTVGSGTATEIVLAGCSCLFPIGSLNYVGAALEYKMGWEKIGTVDATAGPAMSLRIGAVNDAAQTVLMGPVSMTGQRVSGLEGKATRQTATTLRLDGQGNISAVSRFTSTANVARPAASAMANTASSANYLNLTVLPGNNVGVFGSDYIAVNTYDIYVMG